MFILSIGGKLRINHSGTSTGADGAKGLRSASECFKSIRADLPRGKRQSTSNVTAPMISALAAKPTSGLLMDTSFLNSKQAAIAVPTPQVNGASK